jgi:hypothetical protein
LVEYASGNGANARWLDANLDGELDLFLGVSASSEVVALIGNAPSGPEATAAHPLFRFAEYDDIGELRITLDPSGGTPQDTDIELVVWTQGYAVGSTPELFFQDYIPVEGFDGVLRVGMRGDDRAAPFATHRRYYLTVRRVSRTGPSVVASSAVYVGGFASAPSEPPVEESQLLFDDSDQGYEPIPYRHLRMGEILYGLFLPMPRVPHFVPTL